MKKTTLFVVSATIAACSSSAPKPSLSTEDDKTVYALGMAIEKNLETFTLSPNELELVIAGIRDGYNKKAEVKLEEKQPAIQQLAMKRRTAANAAASAGNLKAGEAYQEKVAKEPGAVKTASGLIYIPIKEGSGEAPTAASQVKVNYEGKTIEGKVFDASAKHGGPATFGLRGVVPCWTEGVQLMKPGGKARLVCPAAIAYGDRGAGPDIPPGATLDFEIELLEVVAPPAPATPPTPAAGAPTPAPKATPAAAPAAAPAPKK